MERGKAGQYRTPRRDLLREGKGILRIIIRSVFTLLLAVGFSVLLVQGHALGAEIKTFRTTILDDPQNLDPAMLYNPTDRFVTQNTYQGLVTFDYTDKTFPIIPYLAKSYEVSKDAKTITFKLHKGVKFHNGYGELTSEDVVYSLLRIKDPKIGSPVRKHLGDVERIEAPDRYTVIMHLKTPTAYSLLGNLAWGIYISSKKAFEGLGDEIQKMPIGTGPFCFDQWIPGEKVVLKKFDDYWGTAAKIDKMEIYIIPEEMVALGALEKGKLDLVVITEPASFKAVQGMKNVYLTEAKGAAFLMFVFLNHKKKPLDDLRVRRALCYALDVEGMCKRIGPLVLPWTGVFAPTVFSATDEFWTFEYDLDKAKELLAEAGYPKGFEMSIIYYKEFLYEPLAIELQRCWGKIVDVKLNKLEHAVFYPSIKEFKRHAAIWAITRLTPYLYAERMATGAPENYCQYSNSKLDEALQKGHHATTKEEARKYWREWQKIATEDVIAPSPFVVKHVAAVSNKLKGVVLHPYIRIIVDMEKAYFVK